MPEVYVGRIRSGILHGLLTVATLGLYFFVWYTMLNAELRRHRGKGTQPVLLLLLVLLVPVLGWFLGLLLTAGALRKAQRAADAGKRTPRLVAPVWTLVPVLGWAFGLGTLQAGANRLWDHLHRTLDRATSGPFTLECPQCVTRFDVAWNPFSPTPVACPNCGRAGEV